jgi:hypothetical protein
LLKAGANPNRSPFPPLLTAIRFRNKEMVKLLIEYGADVSAMAQAMYRYPLLTTSEAGSRQLLRVVKGTHSITIFERYGMLELLLDRPANPVVVNAQEYVYQLRLEITKPLRLAISEILVVAFMRANQTPPVGIISSSILSFCLFLDYGCLDGTSSSSISLLSLTERHRSYIHRISFHRYREVNNNRPTSLSLSFLLIRYSRFNRARKSAPIPTLQ